MYTQSITRRHRTAFLLAIDGSGSMAEEIRFRGRTSTKAEAVAAIANELLFELIERARHPLRPAALPRRPVRNAGQRRCGIRGAARADPALGRH